MEQTIINFIKGELHNGRTDLDIQSSDDLLTSRLLESMAMIRLIQFIEGEFALRVPPQDMTIENFMSVDSMVGYINRSKVA